MTCLSWVALYGMAHSFNELHKPLRHNKAVIHEGDRGAWCAIIHVFAKSRTQLSDWTTVFPIWIVIYHIYLRAVLSAPAFSWHCALCTPCFLCVCVRHSMCCCFLWSVIPLVTGYLGWKGRKLYLSVSHFVYLNELLWACPIFFFYSILFSIDLYPFSLFSLSPYPYTVLGSWRDTGSSKIYVKSLYLLDIIFYSLALFKKSSWNVYFSIKDKNKLT